MRLKSALRRGVAAAVIAGIVVSSGIPAYAKTWNIADGDITVKGASDESGNYNNVKQGDKDFERDEGETVITGESDKSTVTIDTSKGDVDVTFDDLKINVSGKTEGDSSGKTEGDSSGKTEGDSSGKAEGDSSGKAEGDVSDKTEVDGSDKTEVDGSGDSPVRESNAAVTVKGDHDATIELDGDNKLKSGSNNAGLEKNGNESSGKLTIKDDNDTKGSLTAEGGAGGGAGIGGKHESGAGNIEITGGTIKAEGGEGAAGIGGGVYGIGHDIEISGGKVSATGGNANKNLESSRPGAAGIGDGAGTGKGEIDSDASSNPNHIYISGDAEVEAKAGASTGGKTAAIGVITHLDGTQELGDVTTAEYDPVNRVLSFDAHGSVFRMTGDSLRELAKEVHELRIRFLDGNGQEMEAVIPLARIKDLVGVNGAFELELSQEGLYRFYVVGQTGYDRKTFSDETALRRNGKELVLVYRVGDEEEKAQETARVEEAIARRKQEKEQWGTVLSGRESSSLSGLPELTQPGTGTVGGVTDFSAAPKDPTIIDMGPITVRPSEQPAPEPTVWKTFTGNIVKLVGGKQDSKKDDPAPSVGGLSGLTTLSPDSLTTVQQPEQAADPGPEDSIRIPLLEDEEKMTIQPFTEKTPAEEQTDTAGPRGQQGRRDDSVRQTEAGPRGQQGRRDDPARQTEAGPRGQQGRRDDSAQQTEAGPRGAQASRDGDKTGEPRGPRGRHAGRGN